MLTERIIQSAVPQDKPYILWCDKTRGLGLRVYPAGRKSFVIMYRTSGALRFATLGRAEDVTLKDVRTRAAAELLKVRQGHADDLATRRKANRDAPTFADLWAKFETEFAVEQIALQRMTTKTVKDYRNVVKAHMSPVLWGLKVKDIRRTDIERVGRRMLKTPTASQ